MEKIWTEISYQKLSTDQSVLSYKSRIKLYQSIINKILRVS